MCREPVPVTRPEILSHTEVNRHLRRGNDIHPPRFCYRISIFLQPGDFRTQPGDFFKQPRNVFPGRSEKLCMGRPRELVSAATITAPGTGDSNHTAILGFDESVPAVNPRPRHTLFEPGTDISNLLVWKRFGHGPTDSRFSFVGA